MKTVKIDQDYLNILVNENKDFRSQLDKLRKENDELILKSKCEVQVNTTKKEPDGHLVAIPFILFGAIIIIVTAIYLGKQSADLTR